MEVQSSGMEISENPSSPNEADPCCLLFLVGLFVLPSEVIFHSKPEAVKLGSTSYSPENLTFSPQKMVVGKLLSLLKNGPLFREHS